MRRFLLLIAFSLFSQLFWTAPAHARRMALDPQNRVHAGASFAAGSIGLTGGLDSRLTRLIYMDVGGFISPVELSDPGLPDGTDAADYVFLRHGLYVAPGIRVPHRQPTAFTWDLLGRVGFSAVWSNDAAPGNLLAPGQAWEVEANPALLTGVELIVRKDEWGLRAGGKGFFYQPYSVYAGDDLFLIRPLVTVEALYQW